MFLRNHDMNQSFCELANSKQSYLVRNFNTAISEFCRDFFVHLLICYLGYFGIYFRMGAFNYVS